MTEAEQIEEFIRTRGVTRCPPGQGFGLSDTPGKRQEQMRRVRFKRGDNKRRWWPGKIGRLTTP